MFRLLAALALSVSLGCAPALAQTPAPEAPKTTETKPGEAKPAEAKPATPPATPTTAAPAAPTVSLPNQFGTLVALCETARTCLKGKKGDCSPAKDKEAEQCTLFFEGVIAVMRTACIERKTNNTIPKVMTAGAPKNMLEMVEAVITFAKDNPNDKTRHKGGQTIRAFSKTFPCEN